MEIHSKLTGLKPLIDPGTILRMYSVTKEDLDDLMFLEAEIARINKKES